MFQTYNMDRVIAGKIIWKWSKGKPDKNYVQLAGGSSYRWFTVTKGKITVNVWNKSRENRCWFELSGINYCNVSFCGSLENVKTKEAWYTCTAVVILTPTSSIDTNLRTRSALVLELETKESFAPLITKLNNNSNVCIYVDVSYYLTLYNQTLLFENLLNHVIIIKCATGLRISLYMPI